MTQDLDVTTALSDLMEVAPAGFAIGLHVRFTNPTFMFQTYPKAWAEEYSREGMVARDPTVAWSFSNEGLVDWSELASLDEAGVLARAREQGLRHGVTVSVLRAGSRSLGSFARQDRAITSEEAKRIEALMVGLHDATATATQLSEPVREGLRRLSIAFTHP